MYNRIARGSMLCLAAVWAASAAWPQAVRADVVHFTFTSTTNNTYNNRAYMLNTGMDVLPGDLLHISGIGSVYVGGGYYVLSNFDMGLVSPLDQPFLVRDYHGNGTNYTGTPYPLAGESVLFSQDRAHLDDDHDLNIYVTAQSAGRMYIGLFDNFFADNTGSHQFTIERVPEPATAVLGLLGAAWLFGRRRGRISGR